ncbi:TPA: tRNA (guanosine(37)-N1)-methyltransferase TrmD [bacterium]|nr:tRNA (guanosine(37)-N1)-methyltransferase TrmD [bacterium]
MVIDILTLFPGAFEGFLREGLIKRAIERGALRIELHNIRDFTTDRHHQVDDYPYGGGPGMILKVEPVFRAVRSLPRGKVILMSPQGIIFDQNVANSLAKEPHLIFICGHYEGLDERIRESLVDIEISIGDYVLSGGEIPALALIDTITRLLPGVLGNIDSISSESFQDGLLEYPQYTRPEVFGGMAVPPILLSGDHGKIREWRRREAIRRTLERRPNLIDREKLSIEDLKLLREIEEERCQEML